MNLTIIVLLAIVTSLLVVITAATVKKVHEIDERINEDAATISANKIYVERKIEEFDQELNRRQIEYIDEISESLMIMKGIVNELIRIDATQRQDHRDLVDIRSRYINFREPIQEDPSEEDDAEIHD